MYKKLLVVFILGVGIAILLQNPSRPLDSGETIESPIQGTTTSQQTVTLTQSSAEEINTHKSSSKLQNSVSFKAGRALRNQKLVHHDAGFAKNSATSRNEEGHLQDLAPEFGEEDYRWWQERSATQEWVKNVAKVNTLGGVREVAQQRESAYASSRPNTPITGMALLPTDYELYRYTPGLRNDLVTTIVQDKDLRKAILGPDYSMNDVDFNNPTAMKKLRDSVLSLGHGGEVVLKVKGNGVLLDGPGADFVIYENVIAYNGKYYQEFAYVGVAYDDIESQYRWFKCDPAQSKFEGCAGVVPTEEGGDAFDLAQVGLSKIRFIKIKDFGHNENSGKNTDSEGFDLDAIRLNYPSKQ